MKSNVNLNLSIYLNYSSDSISSFKESNTVYWNSYFINMRHRERSLDIVCRARLALLRHKYPLLFQDNNNIKWKMELILIL